MRVTQNSIASNTIYNLQQGRIKLDALQESIATQQKVNRPSDDPTSSGVLMDIGDRLKALDQYATSITKANTWVSFTNTALTGMTDIMAQAKKLVSSISSGTSDPSIRQSAHDQLVDLKKQMVDMANTQIGDQYIFSGGKSNVPPFTNTDNAYAGAADPNSTQLTIEIARGTDQAVSITGDRLLLGSVTAPPPSYGETNILETFDNLITAVGDRNIASNATDLAQGATDLQAGFVQITNAVGDNITRMTRLDTISTLNDTNKNMLQSMLDKIQNVDLAQLGVELSSQTTAYQASLSTTAKISQLSLLNYL
ncbi:MAG TPA: flagellar hook-associated protein FlgL [Desulfuromonadales bacterium]|nr:flagellar hook-associated protein FlgL [Desulfuromonadales bacterium]